MSRNRVYSLACTVLAVAVIVVSIIAIFRGELAGLAMLLMLGAVVAAILRIRTRIRAESRHRWVLQARVNELETSVRDLQQNTRQMEEALTELERALREQLDGGDAHVTYTQMALLHDRVLALESSLDPVR